jgi:SAM-dependent methyltransferase
MRCSSEGPRPGGAVRASGSPDLQSLFGGIDIYLFDQLLRGRLQPGMRIVDAGCGAGRNLVYFLQAGYDVRALDADPASVAQVRALARQLAPGLDEERFRVEPLEHGTFPAATADLVICSAVLHFARDDAQFEAMLAGAWRLLAPGGVFFSRLASSVGIEAQVRPIEGRRCRLPDGSERYLVDEPLLLASTARLGGTLLDPLKTTLVHGQRAMTTWVARRA